MNKLLARENDIVTCEAGHPVYRVTGDIYRKDRVRASSFEGASTEIENPKKGTVIKMTCSCGEPWLRVQNGYRLHLESGWT